MENQSFFTNDLGNRLDIGDLQRMIYVYENLKRVNKLIRAMRHIVGCDKDNDLMKDLYGLLSYFEKELTKTGVEV